MEVLAFIFAAFIGISLGLIGAGGSILTVPVLVYLAHVEPVLATAYSLFVVGSTALVGGIRNSFKKLVDFKTAFLFGIPSIAVSLVLNGREHYETAAKLVRKLVERNITDPLPTDSILNINVPDVPFEAIKGVRATRLGFRHKSEPAVKALDPHNRPIYWIGPAGAGQDTGPGTDFHAIAEGFVSVSPIKVDLTAHASIAGVATWFERFK